MRHRGEVAESEEGDVTLDLLLKHPDVTLGTYIQRLMKHLKHTFETLQKHLKTLENTYVAIANIQMKHLQYTYENT
jgi:hypothetical protein